MELSSSWVYFRGGKLTMAEISVVSKLNPCWFTHSPNIYVQMYTSSYWLIASLGATLRILGPSASSDTPNFLLKTNMSPSHMVDEESIYGLSTSFTILTKIAGALVRLNDNTDPLNSAWCILKVVYLVSYDLIWFWW